MKIKELWANYETYTTKASDGARQLGLAGIALIWVFREGSDGSVEIPKTLVIAGTFVVSSLFLDLMQYVIASVLWERYGYYKEKKVSESEDFVVPLWLNRPAQLCFYLKMATLIIGYIIMIYYLMRKFL